MSAVSFDQVQIGDTLTFLTADNGFTGSGDLIKREGVVTTKTDKTIIVTTHVYVGHLNRADGKAYLENGKARLLRKDWAPRDVHRITTAQQPARPITEGKVTPMGALPYNAKHVIILSLDGEILALWTPDPDLAARIKAADGQTIHQLILNPANEIESVATARRFYKREGAGFSGWVVESHVNYGDPIANKHQAMRAIREAVAAYFDR